METGQRPESTQFKLGTCPVCEATCGIEVEVKNNQVVSIRGDKKDPLSKGYICPKATGLKSIHEDPDRIRTPLERTENGWQPISWVEAIDKAARGLADTQQKYGNNSVATYLGNPVVHNYSTMFYIPTLFNAIDSRNKYSATSVDQLPLEFAVLALFGHQLFFPVPDLNRTDLFICLGGNPMASNGSFMTAPNMRERLNAIKERKGKVIVIDPRKTETAKLATDYYAIKPGTDVFLLLAMINLLFANDAVNPRHLRYSLKGENELFQRVKQFTPELVEQEVGITAKDIKTLTQTFIDTDKAVLYGRLGTCTQEYGTLTQWLILAFNILAGKFDRPGGYMFPKGTVDICDMANRGGSNGHFNLYQSRVKKLPEFCGEFPVATLADEISTPGKDQVKSLLTIAGNPVISTPNGKRLDSALTSLDFMVSIDFYINETTKHANILLPPVSPLERSHFDTAFENLAVHNRTRYVNAPIKPEFNAKEEWEILFALQLALEKIKTKASAKKLMINTASKLLSPDKLLDLAIKIGPYGKGLSPLSNGLTLKKIKASPHGIDLGPLSPCLPDKLKTQDKGINLAPNELIEALDKAITNFYKTSDKTDYPLRLIGRRHNSSNNSWYHNIDKLVRGSNECTAMINPKDAALYNVEDSSPIEITSSVGSITLLAQVTDDIREGVVSVPHGWGHKSKAIKMSIAQRSPGVSINDLTDPSVLDSITGNGVLTGVPIKIKKIETV